LQPKVYVLITSISISPNISRNGIIFKHQHLTWKGSTKMWHVLV